MIIIDETLEQAAARETLRRYPEAVGALAFYRAASGILARPASKEAIEWAREAAIQYGIHAAVPVAMSEERRK